MLRTYFDELYDLNRLFNTVFSTRSTMNPSGFAQTNIYENTDNYIVVSKLPGVKKDELNISIKDNSLKISGTRKQKSEKNSAYLNERFTGDFERNFILPEKIDTENIKAELKDGILLLNIPKSPETKPRKIQIA